MSVITGLVEPGGMIGVGPGVVGGTNCKLDRVLHTSGLIVRHRSPNCPLPRLMCAEAALAFSLSYSSAMFS